MNIYIKVEIRARELERGVLLGLLAAERGNSVLVGHLTPSHFRGPNALPAGVIHVNSLDRGQLPWLAELNRGGFIVTSQDEEHGLLATTYDDYATRRFTSETLAQVAAAFTWGNHDRDALVDRYPEHASRLHAFGSPRVDLWRTDMSRYFERGRLPGVAQDRDFILFPSSFGIRDNPLNVVIRNMRPSYFEGPLDPYEFSLYDFYATRTLLQGQFVRAIREMALAWPDRLIVVRPHPIEAWGSWSDLIGPFPNVLVTREGSASDWVRRARVVVHNGCTTGFEAAVAGVPLVSYLPNGLNEEATSNRLGVSARTPADLLDAVDKAWTVQSRPVRLPVSQVDLLRGRFSSLEGELAAMKIVERWAELATKSQLPPRYRALALRPLTSRLEDQADRIRSAARLVRGSVRRSVQQRRGSHEISNAPFSSETKFPPVNVAEVRRIAENYRNAMGRFDRVRVTALGSRLFYLSSSD